MQWRKQRFEPGGVLAEGDTMANTQKKNWEMIVNPDVDGYTEILRKTQKIQPTEKQKNTKTEI